VISRQVASVLQRQVSYLTPVRADAACGLVARTYSQVADEMKLVVPPALAHSPRPRALAAYWMLMREPLMPEVALNRAVKEAAAAAASVANICPYCVDMHSVGLYPLSSEHDAEAITADRAETVTDERIRAAALWARSAHLPDEVPPLPFDAAERAELIGTTVAFHYVARVVNVFLGKFLLPPGLNPRARRRLKRGLGWMLLPSLTEPRAAGRSLNLLPEAALPADLSWASGSPHVAGAVARAAAVFGSEGGSVLSAEVRDLVTRRLTQWRGEDTGINRQWCERLIEPLREADRAAARLTLLTALASYQVDEEVVGEFRRHHVGDEPLVAAVAWAGFAAARRVGARYATPAG
jgi:AhpD family alkylhydroperoxidase